MAQSSHRSSLLISLLSISFLRHIWKLASVAALGFGMLFATSEVAKADFLAFIGKLGKVDVPSTPFVHFVLRQRQSGAAITALEDGSFALATVEVTDIATRAIPTVDLLLSALSRIDGDILVPDTLVVRNPGVVERLLLAWPDKVMLVSKDGLPVKLGSRDAGEFRNQLVVLPSEGLSFTIDAWASASVLRAPIMRDLTARMRVVALVPPTDQIQRRFLIQHQGDRLGIVSSEEELTAELSSATRRLIVVLGHVEEGRFVLRDNRGKKLIDRDVDSVHDMVDKGQSIALLMGCRVACGAARSGPTSDIDAMETVSALAAAKAIDTPLAFFQHVTATVGSMHVEIDVLGRLSGISIANQSPVSLQSAVAATPVRILVASVPMPPPSLAKTGRAVLKLFAISVLAASMGWLVLLLFGFGPRRSWAQICERYVTANNRPELDGNPLSKSERILLLLLGPWALLQAWVVSLLLLLAWFLVPLALILGRPLLKLGIYDRQQMTATAEPWLAGRLPRWVNATVPPLATAIAMMVGSLALVGTFLPNPIEWSNAPAVFSVTLVLLILCLGLQWLVPWLQNVFRIAVFLLGFPEFFVFRIIHAISRLPTILRRIGGRING